MSTTVDAVIVGAGQAGLAMAWHLQRAGLRHRLLEAAAAPGGAWPAYYDSLRLFSPAALCALPGLPFPGRPEHYPVRDEVVAYLHSYVRRFALAVETGRRVATVEACGDGYELWLSDGERIATRSVIAASGGFLQPHLPSPPGLDDFGGRVLHARDYRNPQGFEGQRVVVVGGANSAVQIAVELAQVASVTLASRRPVRFMPQRLLGRDVHFWLRATGLENTRWLNDQSTPVIDDGHYRRAIAAGRPQARTMFARVERGGLRWADGSFEPADVLVFATGFRPAVSYLDQLAPLDRHGRLQQRGGVSSLHRGLYYVGFPRQRNFASATLRGVGPDAAIVLNRLHRYLAAGGARRANAISHLSADS